MMETFYSYYDYMENHYQESNEYYNNNTLVNEYEAPYNMDYITPPIFIFICIGAFLSNICCIVICYKICKAMMNSRNKNGSAHSNSGLRAIHKTAGRQGFRSLSKTSMILTIICVVLYTMQNTLAPFAYYTRFIMFDPKWNIYFNLMSSCICIAAKLSFYLALAFRYYLVFDASYFNDPYLIYKKLFIFGCFITILFIQLISYFGFFWVFYGFINHNVPNTDIMRYSSIIFLLLDLILISVLGYLFTMSILKLVIQIQRTKEKDAIYDTFNVAKTRSIDTAETATTSIDDIPRLRIGDNKDKALTNCHIPNVSKMTNLANLSILSAQSSIDTDYDINNEHKTNINLNVNEVSIQTKQRLDTIDIQHRYRSTSSSMPEYYPVNIDQDIITDNNKKHEIIRTRKYDFYNKKQIKLLNVTTKIALTSFIAMISSFIYQIIWLFGLEINNYSHLSWFNYLWCLDGIIAIICIYFQMGIAQPIYKILCIKTCQCHHTVFCCIHKITKKRTQYVSVPKIKQHLQIVVDNNGNPMDQEQQQQHTLHINMTNMVNMANTQINR